MLQGLFLMPEHEDANKDDGAESSELDPVGQPAVPALAFQEAELITQELVIKPEQGRSSAVSDESAQVILNEDFALSWHMRFQIYKASSCLPSTLAVRDKLFLLWSSLTINKESSKSKGLHLVKFWYFIR